MNNYNKVLLKMDKIEKSAPLECEYEADARHQWPARWQLLKDFLQAVEANVKTCGGCGDILIIRICCDRCGTYEERSINSTVNTKEVP